MLVFRKRLIFWLIKEYFKKWRKAIFFFFIIGLLGFFLLRFTLAFFISKIPFGSRQSVGMVGVYTLDTLPQSILEELSHGLSYSSSNGIPMPDLAKSWQIQDSGKEYIFILKKNIFFSDKTPFTSENIAYNFSDTAIEKPDPYTIVFKLKDNYSPFLVTTNRPIFKKGYVGIGDYKIKDINFNGNFIASLVLVSSENPYATKIYHFYPSFDALKTAFILGEISTMYGLPDEKYKNTSFSFFPNVLVEKKLNNRQLVTLFYNVQDSVLSDEKLRNALSYTIPDTFKNGVRNYGPYPSTSWAYTNAYDKLQDVDHAKILMSASATASKSTELKLEIKTLPRYKATAYVVADAWKKINIKTKIEEVDSIPSNFQIFLGDFSVPKDPDQYSLWHQSQENNITRYKNLRIDKLLEDGRKTVDLEARKKIYMDFQKYLLNDSPATFLYFPYEYNVRRK